MTPQVTTMQARALLDSASSTSFITERLAWQLQLPRKNQRVQVAGIGGAYTIPRHTQLRLECPGYKDRRSLHQLWGVKAVVLPQVTVSLPPFPVPFNPRWKHLAGLCLAD